MKSAKQTNNNYNPDASSHPSFVVDLRNCVTKVQPEKNSKEKKAPQSKIVKEKITKQKKRKDNRWHKESFAFLNSENKHKRNKGQVKNLFTFKAKKRHKNKVSLKSSLDFSFKLGSKKKRSLPLSIKESKKILSQKIRIKSKHNRLREAENKIVWYKTMFSFALALILLVVPLKVLSYLDVLDLRGLEEKIMLRSNAATSKLSLAAESASSFNFSRAYNDFALAGEDFMQAKSDLDFLNDKLLSLAALSDNPKLKLASESKDLFEALSIASRLASNLSLASSSLFENKDDSLLVALNNFSLYASQAVIDSNKLEEVLTKIKADNLPLEYRQQFIDLKEKSTYLSDNLSEFVASIDNINHLLGKSQDRRYLLVFQNNSELRASGGFLGSYALVDVKEGKIKNLEVPGGGSYDTEGAMSVLVKAPEPLWLVNPLWHFWDANWWPNWPTTAKNLMWFYEKSGGSTVDGVISFTPNVVEDLLDITGPIDLSQEYNTVITKDNFWELVQKIVEKDNLVETHPNDIVGIVQYEEEIDSQIPLEQGLEENKENKPKKIIGDLMVKILEVLPEKLSLENFSKIAELAEKNISQKQIMFYFNDEEIEQKVIDLGLGGQVKDAPHDYLMVVNTNIAGQKTDRKIEEKINLLTQVSDSGVVRNNLDIKRSHLGIKNEPLTGVRNVNWLRVYVPLGSRLLSASGFSAPDASYFERPDESWQDSQFLDMENKAYVDARQGIKIYQENGKTVFAGWVMVDPGESKNIEISYELPFNLFSKNVNLSEGQSLWGQINRVINKDNSDLQVYSLLLQKQPGAKASQFNSYLKLPASVKLKFKHPQDLIWNNGWSIKDEINRDKYYYLLLNKDYVK